MGRERVELSTSSLSETRYTAKPTAQTIIFVYFLSSLLSSFSSFYPQLADHHPLSYQRRVIPLNQRPESKTNDITLQLNLRREPDSNR